MILKFPNLDTLRQALSKKILPPAVSETAVTAGFDEQDQLWVDSPASLTRTILAELKKLNVQNPRSCSFKLNLSPASWTELAEVQKYLLFPDLETLRVALTTGTVPKNVGEAPVVAGFDEQERIWVETPSNLSQAALKQLRKLGVQYSRRSESKLLARVSCWPELLPLLPDPTPAEHLEQTPVLFDISSGERLAHLVTEILRLGNDRQSFRWLDEKNPDGSDSESSRGLLRVVGPPYYSLLRAIDRHGQSTAPIAYIERSPRVWVELGYSHPLVEQIKLPPDKMLLIRPPRQWVLVEEAPFHDVYEVMEYTLPDEPVAWEDGKLEGHFQVHLSLKPGGAAEGGELWVLSNKPIDELNRFVQNADDQMLNRLAFAVGEFGGNKTIVLRTRQSKLPPPVLVLNATTYRPFLKLPNLFLPCGSWLHPRLRRDVVRKLLAEDSSQITWLHPAGDGSFTPQSLPEDAFRPLWDWIDYVLDHEKEPLQAWVQAAQFDFEPFICDEENQPKPKKAASSDKPRGKGSTSQSQDVDLPEVAFTAVKDKVKEDAYQEQDEILDVLPADQDMVKWQQELRALEEQFQELEGGLDIPERQEMWPELARLNAALLNTDDAGVCWLNALWGQDSPATEYAWRWFRTEATAVPIRNEPGFPKNRSWVSRVTLAGVKNREITAEDLDWLLNNAEPSSTDLRALAAFLLWASRQKPLPPALLSRLNPVMRFLETHERLLPVRAAWLAWSSVVQLSRGDVLALARARDRLLERLFHNGLRPEQDLPSFLRFAGQPTSQRFRAVRQWLTQLCELAHNWVRDTGKAGPPVPMDGYVDLIFSLGLARLGETDAARELLNKGRTVLTPLDDVHNFLFNAFEYRITQALEGKQQGGPLPLEQLEYLEHMERMPRYLVDRLRQHSKILEPHTRIDPYRHWSSRMSDLDRELAELVDINDKKEVISRVQRLLKDLPKGAKSAEARARILRSALDRAPIISEDFARDMLDQVTAAYDALPEAKEPTALMDQAVFLEKALSVAAHFDRIEHIHPLVNRFQGLLQSQKGDRAIQSLESLAGQCFRGLRKLGMRDEIDQLLTQMASVILQGQDVQHIDLKQLPTPPASLRALLHVAAGWFYFGRDRHAEPVLQAVRAQLFKDDPGAHRERTGLACVYAATVGQAAVEIAQKRLEELFQKLTGIRDTYTTNSHYSLSQLDVVEAVVLAVASDDFTLGTHARRWLDDDEFIVRRRIHRDLRSLMAATS